MILGDHFPLVSIKVAEGAPPRPYQIIRCSVCNKEDRMSAHNGRMPPDVVRAHFIRRGWVAVRGRAPVCPDCETRSRALKNAKQTSETSAETLGQKGAKPTPSPAAAQALALLYMALSDGYDTHAKKYRAGVSDETIAKEVGLSVEVVRARRESDFGPVAIDPYEALRAALTEQQALLERFVEQIDRLADLAKHVVVSTAIVTNKIKTAQRS